MDVVQRCHRGLTRAAMHLQAGDMALGAMEAVMIGFPELPQAAMAKLSAYAGVKKAGTAWQDEPRVPAGQPSGGQWTTGGANAPAAAADTYANPDLAESPPSETSVRNPSLDDGVYHPATDRPASLPTGGYEDAEEGFRHGVGGNEPPYEFSELSELFPGLKNEPGLMVPMAPIDSFLGISGVANEANLAAALAEYRLLYDEGRALDPNFSYFTFPENLSEMSWQARNSTISGLRMKVAATYYRVRGDIRPLQVETIRYLQSEVDEAYRDAVDAFNKGELPARLSRNEAIGNRVDATVRAQLRLMLRNSGVQFGANQAITVNNRDPSSVNQSYRIPDARLGNVTIDWSIALKRVSDPQIRGFFEADSKPDAVVIIRPNELGPNSSYLITRPANLRPKR